MRTITSRILTVPLLLSLAALTGCPPKKKMALQDQPQEQAADAKEAAETKDQRIAIGPEWTEIPTLSHIPFGFDSSALDETARAGLKKNLNAIAKLPRTVVMRIEGHCDQRGTVEYNLALGQRRADAVRAYYATSGVSRKRMETISYGLERTLCAEDTEECWAKNRRSTTKVRNSQRIMVNAEELE